MEIDVRKKEHVNKIKLKKIMRTRIIDSLYHGDIFCDEKKNSIIYFLRKEKFDFFWSKAK